MSDELVQETCYLCRIKFAVPESFHEARKRDGHTFFCPVGHDQCYTGIAQKQRKRIVALEEERDIAKENEAYALRQLAAQKGATTKARKRLERSKP